MTDRTRRTILVVCTANQCRSPMAAGLIRSRLAREGLLGEIGVLSAGTWAAEGLAATAVAIAAMSERGVDISGHRTTHLNRDLVTRADAILVMTRDHAEAIGAEFPLASGRTSLMSALAGGCWDVADPVGGTLDDYRATADELARLIEAGWETIVGAQSEA